MEKYLLKGRINKTNFLKNKFDQKMKKIMKNKKAVMDELIKKLVLIILFLILLFGVYFLLKKVTG